MTNQKVVENWKLGKLGKSLHMSTDGNSLYSYEMKIGQTVIIKTEGCLTKVKHGLNVQSPYLYSRTTSKHVGIVRRYADKMIDPKLIKSGWYTWYLFP